MCTVSVGGRLGDEAPGLQGIVLVDAVWAIFCYWLLANGVTIAGHVDRGQAYFRLGDYDFELAGKEGAG